MLTNGTIETIIVHYMSTLTAAVPLTRVFVLGAGGGHADRPAGAAVVPVGGGAVVAGRLAPDARLPRHRGQRGGGGGQLRPRHHLAHVVHEGGAAGSRLALLAVVGGGADLQEIV